MMGIPRTTGKFKGESSESQMWKVMRTEVEELGYCDENREISGDRSVLVIFV